MLVSVPNSGCSLLADSCKGSILRSVTEEVTKTNEQLTMVRLSLLSAKKRGSMAWKDSRVRPIRPVHT
jgi:hypothetical protein